MIKKIILVTSLITTVFSMEDLGKDKNQFDYKVVLKLTQKGESDTDSIGHFDEAHDEIFKTYLEKKYQNLYKFQRLMLVISDIYDDYAESNNSSVKDINKFLEKNNDNTLPTELKKAWFNVFILNGHDPKSIEERLYGKN